MAYNTPKELFTGICDAIREKDGTTGNINHQDIPARIRAIETGVDTSDATATSSDILNGATAYVKGNKITGNIGTYDGSINNLYNGTNLVSTSEEQNSTSPYNGVGYKNGVYASETGDGTDANFVATGYIPYTWNSSNVIYLKGGQITTASHVRFYGWKSKTGTSAGVAVYGNGSNLSTYFTIEELESGNYYKLTPKSTQSAVNYIRISVVGTGENLIITVNEPITIKGTIYKTSKKYCADDIYAETGINTSDATATADDIVEGKTAYVNGEKITGTVEEYPKDHILIMQLGDRILGADTSTPQFQSEKFGRSHLFRQGSAIEIQTNADTFGNATVADVAKGKTFTSSAGVKLTGTGGGFQVKTGTTTSTTINTGLSSVSYFVIYKSGISATGLIDAVYNGSTTNMNYCSAWSNSAYGTKTFKSGTATPTINGGTITWNITSATSGGLSSSTTYNWMAIGAE